MRDLTVIDCQVSGISGDMLLSSLVHAGAEEKKVLQAVFSCQDFLSGSKIKSARFKKKPVGGFNVTRFESEYEEKQITRRGIDMYRSLASCVDSLDLESTAKSFALESFKSILLAEAEVHGASVNEVNLHETSSIDTFVDLVGCATALQDLDLFNCSIVSTKVAVGSGTVHFSHGTVPNPSNAILQIFKGKPFVLTAGQAHEEVTTPTGAAMLVNLAANSVGYYPDILPDTIGYGAGRKSLKRVPNILRLVLGKSHAAYQASPDSVTILETNLDDISGELVGHLIDSLAERDVKDVTILQGITKKNRPNYIVKVICENTKVNSVLDTIFNETGTMGIRIQEQMRLVLPRSIITVPVTIGGSKCNVQVKVAKDLHNSIINAKVEYEDVKSISSRLGLPLRIVREQVNAQIAKKMFPR